MSDRYRVTALTVTVDPESAPGAGRVERMVSRGAIVSAVEMSPRRLKHLLDLKMIESFEVEEAA